MIFLSNIVWEGAVFFLAGAVVSILLVWWKNHSSRSARNLEARTLLENARREAEALVREARLSANEAALTIRTQTEESFASRRQELQELDRQLCDREKAVNRQLEDIANCERQLADQADRVTRKSQELDQLKCQLTELSRQRRDELQNITQLSATEARTQLMNEVEQDALRDANNLSRRIVEEARTQAEDKARQIISLAIQRYAGAHTYETTTATVALPGDELKGRIIGRDGRNIRAFEAATGVTVLIDDTPNAVVLSGFDPVRREIARESMQRLLLDGRIHPTRIEEIVGKVSQEMEDTIINAGENAVAKANLPPLHPELVKLLGRLRFRLSFNQNILDHSVEVAHLSGLMAEELGLDALTARKAGLLHDIGKAVSHEVEGTHAMVGADLVKRYGEPDAVVNGVASHHNEVPAVGPWGILVSAADAISASRPGARAETMSTYLKRLEDLERIGCSFPGVDKCFAVQAGRELRVMLVPEGTSDDEAYALARKISRRIEEELQYPGQIRVTVIRETRCVEFAK